LTNKALQNIHITFSLGTLVIIIGLTVYLTTFANGFEGRLVSVEQFKTKSEQVDVLQHDEDINELQNAVSDIDQKFEDKFDEFQKDFNRELRELVVQLWKEK